MPATADRPATDLDVLALMLSDPTLTLEEVRRELGLDADGGRVTPSDPAH